MILYDGGGGLRFYVFLLLFIMLLYDICWLFVAPAHLADDDEYHGMDASGAFVCSFLIFTRKPETRVLLFNGVLIMQI